MARPHEVEMARPHEGDSDATKYLGAVEREAFG
jgi:hypothetical protein